MTEELSSEALILLARINVDKAMHSNKPAERLRKSKEAINTILERME